MSTVTFVSGANRGIGFEFARQLADRGGQVIAGYRSADRSRELLALAEGHQCLHAFPADVNNQRQLRKLHRYIRDTFGRLDLLINNAGINPGAGEPLDEIGIDSLRTAYDVNVLGPLLAARYLRPLLAESDNPRIVNIGSRAGLISRSKADNAPYRIGKCALNMLTTIQAQAYEPDGIPVVVMTPGWVRPEMGGPDANLSAEESVDGMLLVIDSLTKNQSGRFFAYDGQEVAL
mgnify:CR=1 FL=1